MSNPSVSISFNTKDARSEINSLKEDLKTARAELQLSEEQTKATGKGVDAYSSKINDLKLKIETQTKIVEKYEEGLKALNERQEQAVKRQKEASEAYEKAKTDTSLSKEEVKKFKDELDKANKGVKAGEKDLKDFSKGLLNSKLETQKLSNELNDLKIEKITSKLSSIGDKITKVGIGATVGLTTPLVALGKKALETASDLEESQNVIDVSFKDSAESINTWSKNLLDTYGISELTAKQIAGTYKSMANGLDVADEAGTEFAKGLTERAADMASFYNVSVETANTALKAVFTGETEALKRYGVVMSQANLQNYAYSQGMQTKIDKMSQAELVQLRYNYVMKATADASGDFQRTVDSEANQLKLAQENVKALSVTLASELLPIAADVLKSANGILKGMRDMDDQTKSNVIKVLALAAAFGPLTTGIGSAVKGLSVLIPLMASNPVAAVTIGMTALVAGLVVATSKVDENTKKIRELKKESDDLSKTYEKRIQDIDETAKSEMAEAEKAIQLKNRLYELDDQIKSNRYSTEAMASAKEELNSVVKSLNSTIPNLNLSIDSETGAWSRQRSEVDKLTNSFYQMAYAKAMVTAYQAKIDEAAKTIVENKEIQKNASLEYEETQRSGKIKADKTILQNKKIQKNASLALEAFNKATANINTAQSQIKEWSTELAKAQAEYEALFPDKENTGGGGSTTPSSGSKKSSSAEQDRKAKVSKFKDDISKQEQAISNQYALEEKLGTLSHDDKIERYNSEAKRYLDYCKKVLAADYMTAAEKKEIYDEYYYKSQEAQANALLATKEKQKQQTENFKNSVSTNEALLTEYWNREEKLGRVGLAEKKYIYSEEEKRYLNYCNEVLAADYMTAEEKDKLYKEYLDKATEARINFLNAEKEDTKKALADQLVLSKKYISEIAYTGNFNGDSWDKIAERISARYKTALDSGQITIDEYNEALEDVKKYIYDEQTKNAERWIDDEKFYGRLDKQAEYEALLREREYAAKVSDVEKIRSIDKEIYSLKKEYAQSLFDQNMDNIKSEYEAQKKAITDKYDLIDKEEREAERNEEERDLQSQAELYKNAVTVEGKERYNDILKQLKDLEKERTKEQRELEKSNELEELEKKYDEYQKSQEESLNKMIESFSIAGASMVDISNAVSSAIISATNAINGFNGQISTSTQGTTTTYYFTQNNKQNIASTSQAIAFSGSAINAFKRGVNLS